MDADFDGRRRYAGACGDFGDRAALDVGALYPGTWTRRNRAEQALQVETRLRGLAHVVGGNPLGIVESRDRLAVAATEMVGVLVARNRGEPGGEGPCLIVGGATTVEREQCLLHE